jgi:hypothetical protein
MRQQEKARLAKVLPSFLPSFLHLPSKPVKRAGRTFPSGLPSLSPSFFHIP